MSKRGENIYKRKDGRWEGRYIKEKNDKKIMYGYVYGKSYKEAKEKLSEAINSFKEEKIIREKNQENFEVIAEEWLNASKSRLKKSSVIKYGNIIKTYLIPKFKGKLIYKINCEDMSNFNAELLSCGGVEKKGLSSNTISSVFSVLKRIFEYAGKQRKIHMEDFECICIKQNFKPMRILTISEQEKLCEYLNNDLTPCNLGILMSMYLGLRIGEICALKWSDISLDEHIVSVNKTMQRLQTDEDDNVKTKIIITEPKSVSSNRKIPIPDNIYYILVNMKRCDNAFLLTGTENEYLEPRTMQNKFKAVLQICKIDDVNFHTLRHTFATRCVEVGFDIKSLSEILGHSNVNITLNKYVHPSMTLKQKNMNMLSNLLAVK